MSEKRKIHEICHQCRRRSYFKINFANLCHLFVWTVTYTNFVKNKMRVCEFLVVLMFGIFFSQLAKTRRSTYIVVYMYVYRISRKFGDALNLPIWQPWLESPNKNLPIFYKARFGAKTPQNSIATNISRYTVTTYGIYIYEG